jgi:hypothetical protein
VLAKKDFGRAPFLCSRMEILRILADGLRRISQTANSWRTSPRVLNLKLELIESETGEKPP